MKTTYQSPKENRPSLLYLGAELHSWLIKIILLIHLHYFGMFDLLLDDS